MDRQEAARTRRSVWAAPFVGCPRGLAGETLSHRTHTQSASSVSGCDGPHVGGGADGTRREDQEPSLNNNPAKLRDAEPV